MDQDTAEALHQAIGERYTLEDVLGEGGMGTVYLARDIKHGRSLAIKTVRTDSNPGLSQRFEREIQLTAGLQHPHILQLIDSGMAGQILYYVMPFVEGESLRNRLNKRGRLPEKEAVRIVCDVLEGLGCAHARGIVHRDIKPSNILLGDGHALIADFGIAKPVAEISLDDEITKAGQVVGTPAYMAPEQLAGQATPQSDLYALGAVLYESLTGLRYPISPLKQPNWVGVKPAMKGILERALEMMPRDRWPSAMAFRDALVTREQASRRAARGQAGKPGVLGRIRSGLSRRHGSPPPSRSIAVLPLENISRDEETEYFADGITEDIIAHLSKIEDLKVISRTSIMRYKDTRKSAREIGAELHVATLLEGSVRRAGDRVRIVSQLIDAQTDEHLWTDTFDRQLSDIFEIQGEVARQIAGALKATISDSADQMLQHRPTANMDAHRLYVKGRYLWNRRTSEGLASAAECFEQAIAFDPENARCHAGLADANLLRAAYGYMPEKEGLDRAREAVTKALELDEQLAEAHASRGQIIRAERDWAEEEHEYQRAIELNPGYATAHQWYATLLAALGRHEEAQREVELAQELDPLSHAIGVTAGSLAYLRRDNEAAVAILNETLELAPDYFSVYAWLLIVYGAMEDREGVERAAHRLADLHPDLGLSKGHRAYTMAHRGCRDEALQLLDEAAGDPTWAAIVLAALGDRDAALEALRKAIHDPERRMFLLHRNFLFYMKVTPGFDSLHSDPRFDELLAEMNFTAA
ncbi:MAG: protein kinase [Gemmatimonadota bacterium]